MIRAFLLVPLSFMLAYAAFAATLTGSATERYRQCTELAKKDAQSALNASDEWMRIENVPSAYHCRAISLFALERYNEAATALDDLSVKLTTDNLTLWANVLRQSSRAWMLAGNRSNAITALGKAIPTISEAGLKDPTIARLAAELLEERARLHLENKRELIALQDLDQALALNPTAISLLLARAKLFSQMNERVMAQQDLERVLIKQPSNAEALALMAKVKN